MAWLEHLPDLSVKCWFTSEYAPHLTFRCAPQDVRLSLVQFEAVGRRPFIDIIRSEARMVFENWAILQTRTAHWNVHWCDSSTLNSSKYVGGRLTFNICK